MEIKIPKEVRKHKETIFFGLTARQFFCAVAAVGAAAGIYLGLERPLERRRPAGCASWPPPR